MMTKCYSELIQIPTFQGRYEYVKCKGYVGVETFGDQRYLNQMLYSSQRWKKVRRGIILRDDGFDLAHKDYPIYKEIYIHHINPITAEDILEESYCLFDPENLISVSFQIHNAIHYGKDLETHRDPVFRRKNDTCPWK